jgi:hypothetical protein
MAKGRGRRRRLNRRQTRGGQGHVNTDYSVSAVPGFYKPYSAIIFLLAIIAVSVEEAQDPWPQKRPVAWPRKQAAVRHITPGQIPPREENPTRPPASGTKEELNRRRHLPIPEQGQWLKEVIP